MTQPILYVGNLQLLDNEWGNVDTTVPAQFNVKSIHSLHYMHAGFHGGLGEGEEGWWE